jgi:hypothetical protein
MSESAVSVAIVSDTHAQLHPEIEALIRCCDIALHAGDICDASILDAMQPRSGRVIAVRGNNDHERGWPAEQADRVLAIPANARVELPGGAVEIEHGHVHDMVNPDHQDLRDAHPTARMVVYGHTHRKVIDDYKQPWVVNPGAAGYTRTRGGPSCLILIASEMQWKLESYRFAELPTQPAKANAA